MDTRSLKVFCAVADSGHLVSAAKKVHLTASAISHTIKGLETELGCRLFERVGKRLALNHAGEQLLAQVRGPLAALDSAAENIRQLKNWGHTRLRIGASYAACEQILPGIINDLKKRQLSLDLRLESGHTPRLLDLLQKQKVELALGIAPANAAGWSLRAVFRDELMFVFAATHAWADGRPITRDEIRRQQYILYQPSSLTADFVGGYFRQLEVEPDITMEVASTGAIIELVKLNLGVSIVAPWTVDRELMQGTLKMRPLGPKPLHRRWTVITLAHHRMNLVEETFCRLCRSYATGLRLDRNDLPPFKPAKLAPGD
jgi:LysR family transcriptional regulator, low CO2-responsive transcriptional regulator